MAASVRKTNTNCQTRPLTYVTNVHASIRTVGNWSLVVNSFVPAEILAPAMHRLRRGNILHPNQRETPQALRMTFPSHSESLISHTILSPARTSFPQRSPSTPSPAFCVTKKRMVLSPTPLRSRACLPSSSCSQGHRSHREVRDRIEQFAIARCLHAALTNCCP
ncbi:uncharacterized protein LAESUDRAFT_100695 [Laetiporus sulphureus 93-53]|uniref:Uncharacterized protein n=1 Tax=Laetiporus sulphureus 93-53 TaxID=1314785 RepID=A0A165ESC0_9APHY|nr:uncharacterized protein LAESUDRAFT_100695 [Laetiporus sulphureus 93-53]KZT07662.1 hypothetical protein LAESUDRAFT_100695 [Laetiporus sulphureus 93-53]